MRKRLRRTLTCLSIFLIGFFLFIYGYPRFVKWYHWRRLSNYGWVKNSINDQVIKATWNLAREVYKIPPISKPLVIVSSCSEEHSGCYYETDCPIAEYRESFFTPLVIIYPKHIHYFLLKKYPYHLIRLTAKNLRIEYEIALAHEFAHHFHYAYDKIPLEQSHKVMLVNKRKREEINSRIAGQYGSDPKPFILYEERYLRQEAAGDQMIIPR